MDLFLDLDVTFGTSIDPTATATKNHTKVVANHPPKMLSATMRSAVTQALRPCASGLPAKSATSRGVLVRRSFLVAPGYKSRVAVRGFATAAASKTTGRTAAKSATKTKAAPKAKAKGTTTKAKKTAKAPAKKKKAAAKPKKKPVVRKKKELSPEKKEVALRRDLKRKSLMGHEPKNLPATRWTVYMSSVLKGKPSSGINDTRQRMSAIAGDFRSLSSAELEVCIPTLPHAMSNRVTD